jgi:hypothetical protein
MASLPITVLVVVAAFIVAAGVGWWLSWTAGRLDRLHLRCETARAALETQLSRRAAVAGELATSGLTDPASALLLLDAAQAARDAASRSRQEGSTKVGDMAWEAESDLTAVVAVVLAAVQPSPPEAEPVVAELRDACNKVQLARRIHNDIVAATLALRSRRRVRWFRLAGGAAAPQMIAFDDRLPDATDLS